MSKHFAKQEGFFVWFAVFSRAGGGGERSVEGTESHRGNRGLYRRQRAVERAEVLKRDRGSSRGKGLQRRQREVERTEGRGGVEGRGGIEGRRESRGP